MKRPVRIRFAGKRPDAEQSHPDVSKIGPDRSYFFKINTEMLSDGLSEQHSHGVFRFISPGLISGGQTDLRPI